MHQVDLFAGLKAGGSVLINTGRCAAALGLSGLDARILTVPASDIARLVVDDALEHALAGLEDLAPLHNGPAVRTRRCSRGPARRSARGGLRHRLPCDAAARGVRLRHPAALARTLGNPPLRLSRAVHGVAERVRVSRLVVWHLGVTGPGTSPVRCPGCGARGVCHEPDGAGAVRQGLLADRRLEAG